jgi:D-alanine-D-alanine ligase
MNVQTAATDGARSVSAGHKAVLDITVLMGGPSTERQVSLVSGEAIASALERRGHKVCRSDISPDDTSALDRHGIDVVFIALHGLFGESGEVQRLCERRGLRYTGSGPLASEIAIDKARTKQVLAAAGLATAEWTVLTRGQRLEGFAPPVVVKPVDGGSSVGVTICLDAATRDAAIADLLSTYGRAMVERFVKGRELTVGVLGERALPPIEIVPSRDFYDYTAKYQDCGTQYRFDHGLSAGAVAALQRAALAAHRGLGCRHMSRVDFIMDSSGAAWLLEVNTIPGFTSHSLLPMAAGKVGIGFDDLVERLARMAMQS